LREHVQVSSDHGLHAPAGRSRSSETEAHSAVSRQLLIGCAIGGIKPCSLFTPMDYTFE